MRDHYTSSMILVLLNPWTKLQFCISLSTKINISKYIFMKFVISAHGACFLDLLIFNNPKLFFILLYNITNRISKVNLWLQVFVC
jgi:hypothetical protein